MHMRYKGASSSRRQLPGSSPQGAFLGILLFIIIFNGALLRPAIPRLNNRNLKYIDDLSMMVAIDLKRMLADDPVDRARPLTFNERTRQILPVENNQMQELLHDLHEFTTNKQLKIKERKDKCDEVQFL